MLRFGDDSQFGVEMRLKREHRVHSNARELGTKLIIYSKFNFCLFGTKEAADPQSSQNFLGVDK